MAITLDGTAGTTTPALTNSALTSGRVTYAGTSGVLQDSANLTFDGNNMTVNGLTVGRGTANLSANSAFGASALNAITTGAYNTGVGWNAGLVITTGGANTCLGYAAGKANLVGDNNTYLGSNAGNASTGSSNVFIGSAAGNSLTTGANNVIIGVSAQASAVGGGSQVVIGQGATGKGDNTAFIGGSSGAYNGANSAAWSVTSDQRIKKNIVDVVDSLNKINALRVVEFDYKENEKHDVGFIAQEFQQVFPDQVIKHDASEAEKEWVGEDQVLGIQQNLVPFLVKAIQELTARVAALEAK